MRSSVLGFGCAPILGSVDDASARRAIDCALDCGVTHFDLARSYGYGEAEKFVGRILRTRRDRVVLATKFGIRATALASALRPLKPLLRTLRRRQSAPPAAESAPAPAAGGGLGERLHARIPLTAGAMRSSFQASLRQLGTDHVDLLFIHEPRESLLALDDLCAEADRLKTAGSLRAWGIALGSDRLEMHRPAFPRFDTVQIDNSPGAIHYADFLEERAAAPNVFFSPFRKAGNSGLPPAEILARMARDFPRSVILCSMFRESHIRANAIALGQ